MSDFTVHTKDTAPEGARDVLAQTEKAYGFLPNLLGVMAEAPQVPKAYRTLMGIFEETSFSPVEQQVVLLTVSYENICTYCVAAHSVLAQMAKMPEDVLTALRSGTPIQDPKLEALRRLTAEVVTTRGEPSKATLQAFYDAGYGQAQVLEVILGVATKTLSNYVNHVAETPLDSAFQSQAWETPKAA